MDWKVAKVVDTSEKDGNDEESKGVGVLEIEISLIVSELPEE